MSNNVRTVVIASHRGGSWKSSLAAGLGIQLARHDHPVVIVDTARAGGLWSFEAPNFRMHGGLPFPARTHAAHPLHLAHVPDLMTADDPAPRVDSIAAALRCSIVLMDLPPAGREEIASLVRGAHLVLVPVPVDIVSIRTLPPFLQLLQEQRARPGRHFDVRAVLVGASSASPRLRELERIMGEHLQPILLGGRLPMDQRYDATMRAGVFPDMQVSDCPVLEQVNRIVGETDSYLAPISA